MIEERGRILAESMMRELQPGAARFHQLAGRPATLAIIATDDRTGTGFLELKRARFRAAGLDVRARCLGATASTTDVLLELHALNDDPAVDGIFLQLPLPVAVDAQRAAEVIGVAKDVDAVGSSNLGRLLLGTHLHLPATPAAVLQLLEDQLGSVAGRSIMLVGGASVTERCIALLVLTRGGTACILAPADPALADAAAGADAVVITTDLPPGDALHNVRNGAVLIDAAYSLPPRPTQWLPPRALKRLGSYLPQYRNVGPLTIVILMQGTLRAAHLLRD